MGWFNRVAASTAQKSGELGEQLKRVYPPDAEADLALERLLRRLEDIPGCRPGTAR